MKKLKTLFCAGIAALASLSLFACGGDPLPEPDPGVEQVEITHHDRTVSAEVFRPDASKFPVVVFSHGYNGYKDDFKTTANYLMENGIGAITFTFCGSGARDTSGFATTDMTLFTEKEDLLAVMDYAKKLKWFDGNLFLLGGSQGGMVSAMAAEDRANDIKGMVLLYAGFSIPDDWNQRYPNDAAVPEVIPWWNVNLGRNFVLTLRDFDIYQNMASFTKPVFLMHAADDDIVPVSYSERAAQTYPNARFKKRNTGGHGFLPANDELLEFIEENL